MEDKKYTRKQAESAIAQFKKEFPTIEAQEAEIKRWVDEEFEANIHRKDGTWNTQYILELFRRKLRADELTTTIEGDPSILNKKNPDSPTLGTSHKIEGRLGREKK